MALSPVQFGKVLTTPVGMNYWEFSISGPDRQALKPLVDKYGYSPKGSDTTKITLIREPADSISQFGYGEDAFVLKIHGPQQPALPEAQEVEPLLTLIQKAEPQHPGLNNTFEKNRQSMQQGLLYSTTRLLQQKNGDMGQAIQALAKALLQD